MSAFTCPGCGKSFSTEADCCPFCGHEVGDADRTEPHVTSAESATIPPSAPGEDGGGPAAGRTSVPGYEVIAELGRGGMGVVYKARQVGLNRLCALKMILAGGHAGSDERRRFHAEALAAARLQNTHIVQVYEVGASEGKSFFAMEYCPGGSLADRLDGPPMHPREAAQIVHTLARAVHAAHAAGIVHRDLKPANVLLDADGEPKITDFGLAKFLDAGQGQTQTGAVLGTPGYMAPEQAGGKAKAVGPPADVYALGAILYALLTGRPPFQAATPLDTLLQVVSDDPVPPSRLRVKTPRDLETICLKCLQKDPRQRYATADALAEDLRRFLDHEPIQARPGSVVGRFGKWVQRRPAAAALIGLGVLGVAVLVLGVVLVVQTMLWVKDRQSLQLAASPTGQEELADAHPFGLAFSPDGRFLAATDRENGVRLIAANPDATTVTLRGHAQPVRGVAFIRDQDGQWLASASGDATVKVWSLDLLKEAVQTFKGSHPAAVNAVAFSPDGQTVAGACEDNTVKLWDRKTGQERFVYREHQHAVHCVAFSADGRFVASGNGRALSPPSGDVKVWEAATGKTLWSNTHKGPVFGVAFSPADDGLATAGSDYLVKLWSGVSGAVVRARATTGPVNAVAFSPNGRLLAYGLGDRTVHVEDAATGDERFICAGHGAEVALVAFTPDGKVLASAGVDGTIKFWDMETGKATVWPAQSPP